LFAKLPTYANRTFGKYTFRTDLWREVLLHHCLYSRGYIGSSTQKREFQVVDLAYHLLLVSVRVEIEGRLGELGKVD